MKNKITNYSALLLFLMATILFAQTVERGPYLQIPTPTSMTIKWNTDGSATGKVYYGTNLNSLDDYVSGASTTRHEITITGLAPNTKYYYKVTGQSSASVNQYFVTAPSVGTNNEVEVLVLGDFGQV